MIKSYNDFRDKLMVVGFSLLSGGGVGGEFSLLPGDWTAEPQPGSPIRWHTGDLDHDPWQWRKRILADSRDVGYAKLFFGKAGYVSREWAPRLMAVRRRGRTLDEAYADGLVTEPAKRIFDLIADSGEYSAYALRKNVVKNGAWTSAYDRALAELQMKMYITIIGEEQEVSNGRAHGWPSSVFTTAETYWGDGLIREAGKLDGAAARSDIEAQVTKHYPGAGVRIVKKFIEG